METWTIYDHADGKIVGFAANEESAAAQIAAMAEESCRDADDFSARKMTFPEMQEELFAVIEQNSNHPDLYWPLIVEFVAQWIAEQYSDDGLTSAGYAEMWREEMS